MKKLLIIVCLTVAMLTVAQPSQASNDDAAYFLGGMLGGMILNEALNPRPRYYDPAPARVYDEPVYERVCTRRWVRVWDSYQDRYVKVRRTTCKVVPVY